MATEEPTVSFRDERAKVTTVLLADAVPAVVAGAVPWRTFRWRQGQAHYSGWYWCATTSGHVVYESRLELARLMLADFDLSTAGIAAQPFLLEQGVAGSTRRHIPDFLLVDVDGTATVVNVKPADRLAVPKVRDALGWAAGLFEGRGWRSEIWSGADPVTLANVRCLAGYRRACVVDHDLVAQLDASVVGGETIGEVERGGGGDVGSVRPAVLHLLWRGVLSADLSVPLGVETVLGRRA